MKRFLPDESATQTLAGQLAGALPECTAGLTLLLRGDLGAGKSTFARALLRALGHRGTVPSPTYTLVEPYELPAGMVYHIDLYRISDEEELRYLGWAELDEGLRIVEWPERAPGMTANADIVAALAYEGTGRCCEITALSRAGRDIVTRLARAPVTEPVD